jgi:anti-anti-sigma regulatory factor
MTGAAIVRWQAGGSVVLAVHGAFDGASAWALRVAMEESSERHFVVDLTHAIEACEFAASVLAQFARERRRDKQVTFRPGSRAHARLLGGFGLELVEDDDPIGDLPAVLSPWSPAKSGAPA